MKTTCLLAATLLIGGTTRSADLDLQPQIEPFAQQLLDNDVAVGFVVGVYKGGQTQVLAYGETEKGKGEVPDGDTVYEIGSTSKALTGVLLADLVERGRVKLDDPMQTYLPESSKKQVENATNITFEHLATHTSGLPRLPDNLQPADPMNPYADYTFQQMFAFLKDHEPRRSPGEYEYSNFGMGLLGVLMASREKTSYEELLIERIGKPCRMDDTCITLSDDQRERLAPPYDSTLQPAKNWDLPTLAGAGGIRSTANDMLKFVAANLGDDDTPLAKACELSHKKRHSMSDGQAIGLAWHIARDGVTRWHNGMTGGYASWLAVVPDYNVGVVVLSNTAADEITAFGQIFTRIALGEKVDPSTTSPKEEFAQRAPFTAVRWQGSQPEVKVSDKWFKLVSLDDVPTEEIVAFSKKAYSGKWQKRFAEDLVELLTRMGHPPGDTVKLVVQSPHSSKTQVLDGVAMTEANRKAIRSAAGSVEEHLAPKVLQKYVGVYAISPQFKLTVRLDDDTLTVQATGQQKIQLYPESETEFFCKVVDARITFVRDKKGKAVLLVLHQNGANQVATRQD